MKAILLLAPLFWFSFVAMALDPVVVESPSGKIRIFTLLRQNKVYYSLHFGDEEILQYSQLGFVLQGGDSLILFDCLKQAHNTFDETWEPVWGQFNSIRNHYNELTLFLEDTQQHRPLEISFRAYDDGVAFRYRFPTVSEDLAIVSEESRFTFADNHSCWWSWADYNTYEKLYQHTSLKEASHVATPFTLKTRKGTYIGIHEAALEDFSSMTLAQEDADSLSFKVHLVPGSEGAAVQKQDPFYSPWRALILAPTAGGLLESSLLLNLNEPCAIKDCSWIKPINYIGIWWEMHLGISTWKLEGGKHGATTSNAKKHIDFAAENGIKGVLIEGWNTGWEHWGKKEAFDYQTPYPDFDIQEVVRYAKSKGIEIIGHHETGGDILSYEQHLDSAFSFYQKLGIHYVKTGYAGPVNPPTEWHHGQYMVNHYNKVMKTAAKYHIMLDVHEPIIPTGWSRTYPNLMTFEGVRGMEWNAWSDGNPPSHTCTLPFTRGLAGPMDYTPGIFDILEKKFSEKRIKWNDLDKGNSAVHSTLTNQIALMIILYSPLQMAADLIENYQHHPAFDLVSQIPTSWDETRVLAAEIGEYILIARRKGTKWFIGGISNELARTIPLPLDFLDKEQNYSMRTCFDAETAHFEKNPTAYEMDVKKVSSMSQVLISMKEGGGTVMILERE
jgi:alpha-glucosidase